MSAFVRPHRQQPTRLPRPWESPGENTGVGCHFLLQVRYRMTYFSLHKCVLKAWTTRFASEVSWPLPSHSDVCSPTHIHTTLPAKSMMKSQKTAQWRKRSSGRNRGQLHNIGNWKKKIIISEFLKLTKTWKSLSTISLCPHVCFWQFWLPGHLTSKQIMAYFVLFCHTA